MTDAAELVKLADCPFCGGSDLDTRGDNAIGCKNLACEAYIDIGHSVGAEARAHVAARWNRRAAQQDGAWMPIESAPKDGTAILVCDATHMDSQKIVFWDVDPKNPPGFHWFVEDAGAYHEKAFTHWRPLSPQPI